jgi:hypothetical protein
MARVAGGKGAGKRRSMPSAQELLNTLGKNVFGDEFTGVTVSATKAEFSSMTDAFLDNDTSMDYYDPKKYRNLGATVNKDGEEMGVPLSADTVLGRQFYEVVGMDELYVPGYKGPQNEEDTSPAPLTLVPTSTTNPERPRTVAAGYDPEEEKLTVMFRDGSLYNYYEVTKTEWATFKANRSKGAVIYRMLDFKPRGYADQSSTSKQAREAFYRFSRGIQVVKGGKSKTQDKTKYKTLGQNNTQKKR